jgi:hypothetical protein
MIEGVRIAIHAVRGDAGTLRGLEQSPYGRGGLVHRAGQQALPDVTMKVRERH